jgi:hypothetical protein
MSGRGERRGGVEQQERGRGSPMKLVDGEVEKLQCGGVRSMATVLRCSTSLATPREVRHGQIEDRGGRRVDLTEKGELTAVVASNSSVSVVLRRLG